MGGFARGVEEARTFRFLSPAGMDPYNPGRMAILLRQEDRVLVQGLGKAGSFHTRQMLEYGTRIVAGVHPGKGGAKFEDRFPIFNTVAEAVEKTGATHTIIFVPPSACVDSVMEAAEAGLKLAVVITEGIPILDELRLMDYLGRHSMRMIGPNCPGVITPEESKLGIMPGYIHKKGPIGVVSRSGTLTYESVHQLTRAGLGQSTCVGIGGDPVLGSRFTDILELFNADPETEAVVLIGEIGGTDEEDAAEYIRKEFGKPVFAFIAGQTAPPGKRMGHAGAIIAGGKGTAGEKAAALREAGVTVVESPAEIGSTVAEGIRRRAV